MSQENKSKPTLRQIISSVFAAAIGVQSDKNRERDFKHGNVKTYVIAGVIFGVLFVATIITIVQVVLKSAQ